MSSGDVHGVTYYLLLMFCEFVSGQSRTHRGVCESGRVRRIAETHTTKCAHMISDLVVHFSQRCCSSRAKFRDAGIMRRKKYAGQVKML